MTYFWFNFGMLLFLLLDPFFQFGESFIRSQIVKWSKVLLSLIWASLLRQYTLTQVRPRASLGARFVLGEDLAKYVACTGVI